MASSQQQVGPLVEAKEVGEPLPRLEGQYVTLQHLERKHFSQIWSRTKAQPSLWTYMLEGPFEDEESFAEPLELKRVARDPYTYAILDPATEEALGYLALMRWDSAHRTVEVGHVMFSPVLQRTRAATEAFFLVMQHAFSPRINCRRLEWKCNNFNAPSKRAAERLGYTFEGIFRQHYIVKGHSRDTAWFSILDHEWPAVQNGFEAWLSSDNFNADGQQKRSLPELLLSARQHATPVGSEAAAAAST